MPRGGAREGSGRKPVKEKPVQITFYCAKELKELIMTLHEESNLSLLNIFMAGFLRIEKLHRENKLTEKEHERLTREMLSFEARLRDEKRASGKLEAKKD